MALDRQSTLSPTKPAGHPARKADMEGAGKGVSVGDFAIVPEPSVMAWLYQSHPRRPSGPLPASETAPGNVSWEGKERRAKSQELEKPS